MFLGKFIWFYFFFVMFICICILLILDKYIDKGKFFEKNNSCFVNEEIKVMILLNVLYFYICFFRVVYYI